MNIRGFFNRFHKKKPGEETPSTCASQEGASPPPEASELPPAAEGTALAEEPASSQAEGCADDTAMPSRNGGPEGGTTDPGETPVPFTQGYTPPPPPVPAPEPATTEADAQAATSPADSQPGTEKEAPPQGENKRRGPAAARLEALQARLESLFTRPMSRRALIIAAAVVAVCLLVPLFSLLPGSPDEDYNPITPYRLSVDTSLFEEDYTVYLRGAAHLTKEQVENGLTIYPRVDYRVYSRPDGSFGIRFIDPRKEVYELFFTDPVTNKDYYDTINNDPLEVELALVNPHQIPTTGHIPLVFSHMVDYYDLEAAITTDPPFSFYPQIEGSDVWLRITEELDYNTEYTIYIDGSLTDFDGLHTLEHDVVFQVKTWRRTFQASLTNGGAELFSPGDTLELEFDVTYGDADPDDETIDWSYRNRKLPVTVELYQFPSLDKYLSMADILVNYNVSLSHLELVDYDIHLIDNGLTTLSMDIPELGGYLVKASLIHPETGEELQFRKAFGVTDLSVYAHTNNDQTLVWGNSSVTGLPLAGYRVEFYKPRGREAAVSQALDDDGLAIFSYIDADSESYYSENPARTMTLYDAAGQLVYVDHTDVLNRYTYSGNTSNRYYAFFHTDRTLYKPTDEVQFWGFIRGYRANPAPTPTTATVILGEGYLDLETEVQIGADGTFIGSLPLEAVRSSHYSLALKLPGAEEDSPAVTLRSKYLQIKEYEKPTYVISSEVDKDYYNYDETVTVTITPTFYDGTPMPFFDLEFQAFTSYYGDVGYTTTITTDEYGVATATFPAFQLPQDYQFGWRPYASRYMVRIADDGENISHYGTYSYFPTDLLYTGEFTESDGGGAISLRVNAHQLVIPTGEDISNLSSRYFYYSDASTSMSSTDEIFIGGSRDMDLNISVRYRYYDRDGQYVSADKDYALTTQNGSITIDNLLDNMEKRDTDRWLYLYATISGLDSAGRKVGGTLSYSKGRDYNSNYEQYTHLIGYNFAVTNSQGEDVLGEFTPYLTYNEASFGDKEQMNFTLLKGSEPVENEGRLLYTINQGGVVQRGFTTSSHLQFTQSVELANSFNLVAAYFDGVKVHPIRDTVITFYKPSAALTVEAVPDRETYRPGEQVTIRVRVTDFLGNGVSSSTIVGVVDESLFALQEQSVDVLYDLYRDFYFNHYGVKKYTTATGDYDERESYGMGDGGKGGGDDLQFLDNLRKNFKDTALFQQVRTDSSGNGSITFTLPDNVTSWRVTTASVSDGLYGGESKTNFITTMPFFLKPVISSKYIEGDDIAMLVQAHGVALSPNDVIDYTVNVRGDGVDETRVAQNVSYQSSELNFGKLPQGEYVVTAVARSGEYSDAVEMTLAVISSNLELVISRNLELDQVADIQAMRYPLTISFYDKAHEPYYSSISSLLTHYCMQASQRMSRFVGKRALTRYMDPDQIPQHIAEGNETVSDMQNEDGGIGYYAGSKSSPDLTAKVLIVAKDQFDLPRMAKYFYNILDEANASNRTEASCYLGLAALGEPVGDDIKGQITAYTADTNPQKAERELIYLVAALAYLDDSEALAYYDRYITPYLKARADAKYYQPFNKTKADDSLTAAAWIAASRLGHPDADAFSLYFAQNPWRISTLWECMIYVTHYNREVSPTSFTYTTADGQQTVNLGVKGQQTLSFNKSQFEQFSLVSASEQVAAKAYFIGEPEEADIQPSDLVAIRKDIVNLGQGRYRIALTINFEKDAPTGQYDISDWVPSNTRLYTVDKANRGSGDYWYYNYSTEGQKVYFNISRHSSSTNQIQLWYTVQRTFDAEAVVDSAYIIHGDTGENNLSERTMLK